LVRKLSCTLTASQFPFRSICLFSLNNARSLNALCHLWFDYKCNQ
jgi:hypothetical protein